MAKKLGLTSDMYALLKRMEGDGGRVSKRYVMKTPHVSRTIKGLLRNGLVVGIDSDNSQFELTPLAREILTLTPRWSGEKTLKNGDPCETWNINIDNGHASNPEPRVEMRSEPRKTVHMTDSENSKKSMYTSKLLNTTEFKTAGVAAKQFTLDMTWIFDKDNPKFYDSNSSRTEKPRIQELGETKTVTVNFPENPKMSDVIKLIGKSYGVRIPFRASAYGSYRIERDGRVTITLSEIRHGLWTQRDILSIAKNKEFVSYMKEVEKS